MVVISLERYFAIVWCVVPGMRLSRRRAWISIVLIWIWAAIWPSPPLFGIGNVARDNESATNMRLPCL
ncbi:unnamed protein product [Echinostoma caproni]|uniref:G_PROTEIN_RECEP_F1_2 domain-containing protein n=1 Tax=Echinostoma caproni TaxID=27848 RepID=A0A183B5X4_9TREM|nr:unnamed protein product [Echinostoma caproni]